MSSEAQPVLARPRDRKVAPPNGTVQAVSITSERPGEQWFLVPTPLPEPNTTRRRVVLFVVRDPLHAGAHWSASIRVLVLHDAEGKAAELSLHSWVRKELKSGRCREYLTSTDTSLYGALLRTTAKAKTQFLPAGMDVQFPDVIENPDQGRKVHMGLSIGTTEISAVRCASCAQLFTAALGQPALRVALRMSPDGPLNSVYVCGNCFHPGLALSGGLNLGHGVDGAVLER